MLFELWKWVKIFLLDLVKFNFSHLKYDIKNICWYLWYGFTFSDIQDLDAYLCSKIADTLEQYNKHFLGWPDEYNDLPDVEAKLKYLKELQHLKFLAGYCISPEYDDLHPLKQQELHSEFLHQLSKYYFSLWF